jgi:hypothetical protein
MAQANTSDRVCFPILGPGQRPWLRGTSVLAVVSAAFQILQVETAAATNNNACPTFMVWAMELGTAGFPPEENPPRLNRC